MAAWPLFRLGPAGRQTARGSHSAVYEKQVISGSFVQCQLSWVARRKPASPFPASPAHSEHRSSVLQEWQVWDEDLPFPAWLANVGFVPAPVISGLTDYGHSVFSI